MIKKHNILNKSILISLLLIIGFSVLAQRTTVGNLLVEAAGEIPSAVSEELIIRLQKLVAGKAPAHLLHQGNSGATPHHASIGG